MLLSLLNYIVYVFVSNLYKVLKRFFKYKKRNKVLNIRDLIYASIKLLFFHSIKIVL